MPAAMEVESMPIIRHSVVKPLQTFSNRFGGLESSMSGTGYTTVCPNNTVTKAMAPTPGP